MQSPQALQQARQTSITTGGRAPVYMHDRDAMRRQLCDKEFQAQIHDTRAGRKQSWQVSRHSDGWMLLLGEYGSVWRCAPHRQPLGRAVLGVCAKDSGDEPHSLRVTVSQEQPVLA
jgi:hypothetical protein